MVSGLNNQNKIIIKSCFVHFWPKCPDENIVDLCVSLKVDKTKALLMKRYTVFESLVGVRALHFSRSRVQF